MIEKTLYYTPSIEEFHVGFRYQFKTLSKVEDRVFNTNDGGYYNNVSEIVEALKEGSIRVKYLDEQDLKELGFEVNSVEGSQIEAYYKANSSISHNASYSVIYDLDDNFLYIEKKYSPKLLAGNTNTGELIVTLFNGKVKNYNELKRIKEQLLIRT